MYDTIIKEGYVMDQIAIRGIYKTNSRGRAYFVWYDALRKRHIVKITQAQDIRNGETVNIIGTIKGSRMLVQKINPCIFEKMHRKKVA